MPKLTSEQKLFIVGELAMFAQPTEVAARFFERFGVRIERSQIAKYDPDSVNSVNTSQNLRDCFLARRKRFLEEIDDIPIAHRAYRILQLQRMFEKAIDIGNRGQAMQILEQAAKETGGSFTNDHRVKVTGKVKTDRALSADEMKAALADAIVGALEKAAGT